MLPTASKRYYWHLPVPVDSIMIIESCEASLRVARGRLPPPSLRPAPPSKISFPRPAPPRAPGCQALPWASLTSLTLSASASHYTLLAWHPRSPEISAQPHCDMILDSLPVQSSNQRRTGSRAAALGLGPACRASSGLAWPAGPAGPAGWQDRVEL